MSDQMTLEQELALCSEYTEGLHRPLGTVVAGQWATAPVQPDEDE